MTLFVTFTSFHGGVGRTTITERVAIALVSQGKRVLLMDMHWDGPQMSLHHNHKGPGAVDLLLDAVSGGEAADLFQETFSWQKYIATLPNHFFLPAGSFEEDQKHHFLKKVTDLDLPNLYQMGSGLALMKAFKELIQKTGMFDLVLVDGGPGLSDMGGINSRDLADVNVVLTRTDFSGIDGTDLLLHHLKTGGKAPTELLILSEPALDSNTDWCFDRWNATWGSPLPAPLQLQWRPSRGSSLVDSLHIADRLLTYL